MPLSVRDFTVPVSLITLLLRLSPGHALTVGLPGGEPPAAEIIQRLGHQPPGQIGFSGGLGPPFERQLSSALGEDFAEAQSLSGEFTRSYACAPSGVQLHAALARDSGQDGAGYAGGPGQRDVVNGSRAPSFYLHETGAFNFSSRVACFSAAIHNGSTYGSFRDDADNHVMPNVAEHLTDFWFVEQLRHHPARTSDIDAADFHVVGAALRTSWFASQLDRQECGSEVGHFQRVDELVREMLALEAFRKSGGRNFVFVDSDWNWNVVFGHRLASIVRDSGAVLATVDTTIASFGGVRPENVVVIPYKAHFELENAAFAEKLTLVGAGGARQRRVQRPWSFAYHDVDLFTSDRNVSFTFHGTMERVREGRFRTSLRSLGNDLANASVQDVRFGGFSVPEVTQVTRNTADTLLRSEFCFVPSGDTPSSRRLFDALAAGCVPIVFSDLASVGPNLPFRDLVDWSKVAIFAGSLQCASDRVSLVTDWLRCLEDPGNQLAAKAELLRHFGRQAFVNFLSYRSKGLAAGVVSELKRIKAFREWRAREQGKAG